MDTVRITAILSDCLGQADSDGKPLPGSEIVDVWMLIPLKTEKVRDHAAEMSELLSGWPHEYGGIQIPPLGGEINYLTMGAVLDSQQSAFVLFAFGKLLGWWDVLEPASMLQLDKEDETAKLMVGQGFVAIIGFRPEVTS